MTLLPSKTWWLLLCWVWCVFLFVFDTHKCVNFCLPHFVYKVMHVKHPSCVSETKYSLHHFTILASSNVYIYELKNIGKIKRGIYSYVLCLDFGGLSCLALRVRGRTCARVRSFCPWQQSISFVTLYRLRGI